MRQKSQNSLWKVFIASDNFLTNYVTIKSFCLDVLRIHGFRKHKTVMAISSGLMDCLLSGLRSVIAL